VSKAGESLCRKAKGIENCQPTADDELSTGGILEFLKEEKQNEEMDTMRTGFCYACCFFNILCSDCNGS